VKKPPGKKPHGQLRRRQEITLKCIFGKYVLKVDGTGSGS
jgi:hypothetical protein